MGTLIMLIIVLVVVGFACWLIGQIPMNGTIQRVLIGTVIFVAVIWLLFQLPLLVHSVGHIR
jgi:hypothetical protein